MRLESYRLKQAPPLSEDYLHRFDAVRERFEYDPRDNEVWHKRARWLDASEGARANRRGIAEVLERFNRRVHNAEPAMRNIEYLKNGEAPVIVGGQQAGLFSGPLLVIYKAVTIIHAAKKASEKLNRPVVPVFWIAGEDHDFDEVDHIHVLSRELKVEKIRLERQGDAKAPVSDIAISGEQWTKALDRLESMLPDTEFKPGLLEKITQFASDSGSLVDLFARLLAWWFGKHGLVLLDSHDPALRRLEAPMFAWMLENTAELNRCFLSGTKDVETLGYKPQAEVQDDQANLFVVREGERLPLMRQGSGFVDRKGRTWTATELAERAENAPETLSNNVLTRPLMQEYVLPVLGVVLGRSETAYWAQLREAFRLADFRMPPVVPRTEYTLLEGTVQKHMRKFGLSFEDVFFRLEEEKERWLKSQDEWDLDELFAETKRRFSELYTPVREKVGQVHPGLKKLGETNTGKIMEQIAFLEKRAKEALESRNEASLRQFQRIGMAVKPLGRPQERVYNPLAYLNKYGTDWLEELINTGGIDGKWHQIVLF